MLKVYDFVCPKCETTFEQFVKSISHAVCPNCGNKHVISAPSAIKFKATGSGVYDRSMKVV